MSDNKVTVINNKFPSKELSENSKEKDGTNSILVTDSVTVPNQDNKQQSHDDKQKSHSRKLCEYSKGESSNSTTNASIDEQLNEFKRKKKEEYYKYKQSVCSDAGEKDKSVKNDQWPIGTTVIVGDSILNGIVEEKLCGKGRLVRVDVLGHHIIPIIRKKPTNIIIDIGTNYAPSSTSREIQDYLLKLKVFS